MTGLVVALLSMCVVTFYIYRTFTKKLIETDAKLTQATKEGHRVLSESAVTEASGHQSSRYLQSLSPGISPRRGSSPGVSPRRGSIALSDISSEKLSAFPKNYKPTMDHLKV